MAEKPHGFTPSGKPKWKNEDLPAGAPLYFYCERCGEEADVKDEEYEPEVVGKPRKVCQACHRKDLDNLTIILSDDHAYTDQDIDGLMEEYQLTVVGREGNRITVKLPTDDRDLDYFDYFDEEHKVQSIIWENGDTYDPRN